MIGMGTPSSQSRIPLPMISSLNLLRCENAVIPGKGAGTIGFDRNLRTHFIVNTQSGS